MSRLTDPFWPFMQLRREISQLLDGFEGDRGAFGRRGFPPVNIWEDGDNFYAEAEIPGVSGDNLEIFTIGDELTLRGKRESAGESGVVYHRQERGMGDFERVVKLPAQVEADKVEARLHHGVLTITMPKAQEARPRKITVKAG